MRKLNYDNEDICVCFIRGKEPPKSILEGSGNILEPNRRNSKRSRKTNFGNSVNLNVSGSTSVYQLKLMIWESFGVWYQFHTAINNFTQLHSFTYSISHVFLSICWFSCLLFPLYMGLSGCLTLASGLSCVQAFWYISHFVASTGFFFSDKKYSLRTWKSCIIDYWLLWY